VPSNRKPARAEQRSRLAAAAVVVLVAAGIAYLAIRHAPVPPRPTGCVAGSGQDGLALTVGQAGIAATIAGVASDRAMPTRAVAIAYAAALQESKLANLHYGDLDSVGVFQQRPSEGWGTPQQIEDPVYATNRFFAALAEVPHYLRLPIYAAAQAVQHSADGLAYGQYAQVGTELAKAFTGALPHAVWCSYGSGVGKPRLAAARRALTSAFGSLAGTTAGDPAVSIDVSGTRLGWAVAAWLVADAGTYGIGDVHYRGYEWLASTGSGHWVREAAAARAPAASAAVVFG
jgi:hypothetical protein